MIPLPEKPKLVILIDTPTSKILNAASNIAPELDIVVTTNAERYKQESLGKPFNQVFSEKYIVHLHLHQTVRRS